MSWEIMKIENKNIILTMPVPLAQCLEYTEEKEQINIRESSLKRFLSAELCNFWLCVLEQNREKESLYTMVCV